MALTFLSTYRTIMSSEVFYRHLTVFQLREVLLLTAMLNSICQ